MLATPPNVLKNILSFFRKRRWKGFVHVSFQIRTLNVSPYNMIRPLILTAFLVFLSLSVGCERQLSDREPPLRPLVYTELPPMPEQAEVLPLPNMVNISPEDLGYTLFHALVDHDRSSYESMFISPEALTDLIHLKHDAAVSESRRILSASEVLWTLFAPELKAEEPLGMLSTRLKLNAFRLGKGRTLSGKIALPDQDEVVQHWGNEFRIELVDTEKVFVIRIPKIVRTRLGWRIAQPVEIDPSLRTYLETGMHLKSELMMSEHYPFPMEVGNYWKYLVEQPYRQPVQTEESADATHEPAVTTVTDMITEIIRREGFWLVSFERTTTVPEKTLTDGPQTHRYTWLVTPKMIFSCTRDCRNHVDNISYILGYIARQAPLFVFPLEPGAKWSTGGRRSTYNRYEVKARLEDPIDTPCGSFKGVYDILGSIETGRENRFFSPGIGIVSRTIRSGIGQTREILIKYRII